MPPRINRVQFNSVPPSCGPLPPSSLLQAELMVLFLRGKHASEAAALASSMVRAASLQPA